LGIFVRAADASDLSPTRAGVGRTVLIGDAGEPFFFTALASTMGKEKENSEKKTHRGVFHVRLLSSHWYQSGEKVAIDGSGST